jgi:alpha-glucosidase
MKRFRNINLFAFIIFIGVSCTNTLTLKSPNKKNSITLELNDNGSLFYSIQSHGTRAIEKSLMGMNISDSTLDFNSGLTFVKTKDLVIDEAYTLPTGKTSVYINKANESVFSFKNRYNRLLNVVCRAYNDGIAFRYIVESSGEITITKENTRFSIPQNTLSWIMDYVPNYEGFYYKRLLDTIGINPLSYPALMQIDNKVWMLLTEACVYDQPATHFKKTGKDNEMTIELPEKQFSVKSKWESPWRTFILGTKLATIVESVMVENLNPSSLISDMSWIEPGVTVFPWWGNYMANSYIDTLKMYVDLAAEMNWKWIEFDVSLVGSPLRTSKLWETTKWLPDFIAYAKSKGINVYGWDEISVLKTPEGREYVYGKYMNLGIKGIKIDYIDSDKQYAMRFRNEAMHDAGQKRLMVSFHGETVPHGQRRTYPNVMTLEGVHGAEYYTFSGGHAPTPEHNCTLPFTRNVVGSMDYTPVTFTIRPESPRKTTYAHELALAVIFESGWMVMADRPKAYLNSPAKEIMKKLESTWDETRFIDGYPGDYVCLARRKGDKWFIAAINSGKERTVDIPLSFIGEGKYSIKIYEDKPGEEMTNLRIRNETVTSGTTLSVTMMANGGFCTIIE